MQILLGHPDEATRRVLATMLDVLEHQVIGNATTAAELKDCLCQQRPQLIISGVAYPDRNGVEVLAELSDANPVPSIIISRDPDLDDVERAMDDHVMAYLVEPITKEDLRPLIHVVRRRFEQFEELRRENEDLRHALRVRKKMERAKGILMRDHGFDEEAAFLQLQRNASSRRMKMEAVADEIIESIRAKADA